MIPANFRRTLRYQGKDDPASLLADLEELLHGARESAKIQLRHRLRCLIVGAVAGIVGDDPRPQCRRGTSCGGVLDRPPRPCRRLHRRVSRWIIDERRCKLAAEVVRALGCDLSRKGKLDLTIDFNEYHEKQYRTGNLELARYAASDYRHAVACRPERWPTEPACR